MAFQVYPDGPASTKLGTPANTPVLLAAGAPFPGSQFVALAALVGPDPFNSNLPTTFIRISMSLPALPLPMDHPQIELQASNPGAGTTGTPQIITGASYGTGQSLDDGNTPLVAAAIAFLEPPFLNNVYLVKVVTQAGFTGITFSMRITNGDTLNSHDFVWVAADSDLGDGTQGPLGGSQQPWIQVTPPSYSYGTLVNQTAAQTGQLFQINNRGTGNLSVSGVSPALPAQFAVNTTLPLNVSPNPALPLPTISVGFVAPATATSTPVAASSAFQGDGGAVAGAGRNNAFSLSATAAMLEVALMLDDSGSMAATDTTSGSTRLNELQSAANQFLEYLAAFGQGSGNVGVLIFPGTTPNNPTDTTSYNLVKQTPITADLSAIENTIKALTPVDNTPMDYAFQDMFTASPPYFLTDATSTAFNRRWLLLMSDGMWNVGPDPNGEVGNLKSRNIVVFSAGYGQSGQVDYGTLKNLAIGAGATPGGQALQVDIGAGSSAMALAKQFKTVITSGLTSVNSASDPTDTIYPGQVLQYEAIVTHYDTKAVFSINWDTPNLPLSLELISPIGDTITAQSADASKDIRFSSDSRYQMYTVDGSYLRNDANPASPRYGTWRMVVTYPNPIVGEVAARAVAPPPGQPFSYDVLTDSSLRLDISLDRSAYYAGDTIGVTAKLTADGLPVSGASVTLSLTAPSQSMDNWLAGIPITPAQYAAAAQTLAGKDASAIYIKAYAAQTAGFKFVNPQIETNTAMSDPSRAGLYTASVSQIAIPDGHTLYVTAVGTTADGVTFRRERSVGVLVGVRPDPAHTIFNMQYDPFVSATSPVTGTVIVAPLDPFNNVVLVDPNTSKYLALQATGATLGPLTTTFNGSYSATFSYPPGSLPTISLTAGGVTIANNLPLAAADQLEYVDEVIAFVPGLAAAVGANQHANPNDVIGDIRQKPASQFVSLGAYGSITVGLRGQVILGRGADDVTVFVEPDVDPRSYRVEAGPLGSGGWVVLGHSAGQSASFSLSAAGLTAAIAIRIIDTSGRTRDGSNNPLATPGVSIRGVGVASSTSVVSLHGGCERLFIGFFSNGGAASVANFPTRFVSRIDGYQYKQSEVSYEYFLHSTRKPAAGFVQGQQTPPAPANANSGSGDVLYMLWDVDDATGMVSLATSFYVDGKQETPTNDGCVKVYAMCQRSV